jgi:hypothetical protein
VQHLVPDIRKFNRKISECSYTMLLCSINVFIGMPDREKHIKLGKVINECVFQIPKQ